MEMNIVNQKKELLLNKKKQQKMIAQEVTLLKSVLEKQTLTIALCKQMVELANKQAILDKGKKKLETTYRDVSRLLNLPDRGVKDSKTILSCYNKLVKSDINEKCVVKVITEKSISQAARIISALNYCDDNDKELYINGNISSSELYKRRNIDFVAINPESLEDRAKRLKDDSETQITYAMITGMFKGETCKYLDTLCAYINMIDDVSDKRYTRDEALAEINLAYEAVTKAITSFKEAIINKSNTIMEE